MIIFFYKTLRLNFSREISMIGSAFFLINPRIYPDFFYNPNDIWFSFFLVLCIYNSLIFFKKKSLIYFLILPILISLAINVRIIGIYIYFIFLLIFLFKCVNKAKEYLKILKYLGLQIIILILSLYLSLRDITTGVIFVSFVFKALSNKPSISFFNVYG